MSEKYNSTHTGAEIDGAITAVIDKSTSGALDAKKIVTFNSTYDASSNKAATMSDIKDAIGDAMASSY